MMIIVVKIIYILTIAQEVVYMKIIMIKVVNLVITQNLTAAHVAKAYPLLTRQMMNLNQPNAKTLRVL